MIRRVSNPFMAKRGRAPEPLLKRRGVVSVNHNPPPLDVPRSEPVVPEEESESLHHHAFAWQCKCL